MRFQRLRGGLDPFAKLLMSATRCLEHQLVACASCSSFNVLPLASFQSVRPFDERPKTTAEAKDGELKV
jgi:hypothetical protein